MAHAPRACGPGSPSLVRTTPVERRHTRRLVIPARGVLRWPSSPPFHDPRNPRRAYGKGLVQCEAALGEKIREKIARLQWSLWHGQVDKAPGKIDDLASSIEPFSETYARSTQLVKALSALRTDIGNNQYFIPNDGQRYHQGEAIATGFVA